LTRQFEQEWFESYNVLLSQDMINPVKHDMKIHSLAPALIAEQFSPTKGVIYCSPSCERYWNHSPTSIIISSPQPLPPSSSSSSFKPKCCIHSRPDIDDVKRHKIGNLKPWTTPLHPPLSRSQRTATTARNKMPLRGKKEPIDCRNTASISELSGEDEIST
jgi:hypothetical protein